MKLQDVKWVVDEYLLEDRHSVGKLSDAFSSLGIDFEKTKYVPFSENQNYGRWNPKGFPVVLYGTWGWIKRCHLQFSPGAYGCTSIMDTQNYYPQIPREYLLNADYFVLPFGELGRNEDRIFSLFGDDIFLRPMSGGKTFAGFPVNRKEYQFELRSSFQLTSVDNSTMVMISSANPNILGEYRFIIGNRKIISSSQYRYDDKLDIRNDTPKEATELAEIMANLPFQPDTVYTCDVATLRNSSPKIIELNSFSCAGLYACNKKDVILGVSEIALKEWNGEL